MMKKSSAPGFSAAIPRTVSIEYDTPPRSISRLSMTAIPQHRLLGLERRDVRRHDDQAVQRKVGNRPTRDADMSEMNGIETAAVDSDSHG